MPLNLKSVANGSVILNPASTVTDKTITIPATDGTMVVQDGTNTTTLTNVSYSGTLTGGTGVINIGSGQVYKDASGNVGIGTASPTQRLSIGGAGSKIDFARASDGLVVGQIGSQSGTDISLKNAGGVTAEFIAGANELRFATNSAERARIDSSGNFLVGTTSFTGTSRGNVFGLSSNGTGYNESVTTNAGGTLALWYLNRQSSTGSIFDFRQALNTVGSITVTGSSTAYNTSSDYRLKENVAPMTGALATVAQLKPCTYTWKVDGSAGQGFIAHELQAVVPDCVTGEKDAVDAEGKPQYQGVDTSFLVATLVAAIQELKSEFDAYKLSHP